MWSRTPSASFIRTATRAIIADSDARAQSVAARAMRRWTSRYTSPGPSGTSGPSLGAAAWARSQASRATSSASSSSSAISRSSTRTGRDGTASMTALNRLTALENRS
jgi:hypothetical protein